MPVLINFKICDNSKDCSGIDVCPAAAFYWDEKHKTIAVDDEKCISCGSCEKACPVGAIRVARTDKEYQKIQKEIEKDPRNVSDLFVDRYGADPIDPAFLIPQNKFAVQILESTKPAVVELFDDSSIKCLLKSIPVKDLFKGINIKYRKIKTEKGMMEKYAVTKLPALLFFKDGKLIDKIEGYYTEQDKQKLLSEVALILNKNRQEKRF